MDLVSFIRKKGKLRLPLDYQDNSKTYDSMKEKLTDELWEMWKEIIFMKLNELENKIEKCKGLFDFACDNFEDDGTYQSFYCGVVEKFNLDNYSFDDLWDDAIETAENIVEYFLSREEEKQ